MKILFNIKKELEQRLRQFHYLLKSVNDYNSVNLVFNFEINVVFHAAAYKHVYMTENMPHATILNNILGTKNVIDEAIEKNVSTFVFVSTDKAENPLILWGHQNCRFYVSSLSSENKTKLLQLGLECFGFNGSVVPIFQRQIAKGGP